MEIMSGPLALLLVLAGPATLLAALGTWATIRFRRARIGMGILEFFTRLIRGKGFENLDPGSLREKLDQTNWNGIIVDLREPMTFRQGHIPGVIHRPFDDFLREVIAEGRYDEYREKDVVLVCDSGHMSRVAGEVLGLDLGFTRVFNLTGGMKKWWRWQATQKPARSPKCCPSWALPRCCTRAA